MISIFYAEQEKERIEKEKRLKARKKANEEELMRLGITEEEFQEQERKNKIQKEKKRKKDRKKEGFIIALGLAVFIIISLVCCVIMDIMETFCVPFHSRLNSYGGTSLSRYQMSVWIPEDCLSWTG